MTASTPADERRARFETLYHSTRGEVLGYLLRRTPEAEDAADLLAEVYVVAWRRLDAIPTTEEARLWLFGVARRILANARRRERTTNTTTNRLHEHLRVQSNQAVAATTDPVEDAVHQALERLDPDQRELITLTAWEGLTPTEIAIMAHETPAVIRGRIHRARSQLRLHLARLGVDPDDNRQPALDSLVG